LIRSGNFQAPRRGRRAASGRPALIFRDERTIAVKKLFTLVLVAAFVASVGCSGSTSSSKSTTTTTTTTKDKTNP